MSDRLLETSDGTTLDQVGSGVTFSLEMGPIRPPSEGNDRSLLLRVNRNCPWNKCNFCNTYLGQRFEYRGLAEVLRDVEAAKRISELLKETSWAMGRGGMVDQQVLDETIALNQHVYGPGTVGSDELSARISSLVNVAGWLLSGAKTVFLQDGDAIIMRVQELIQVLAALKSAFPSIERITSYGRASTANRSTVDELRALHDAGLTRVHVGLESACDDVLVFMNKGVTAEQQISAGQKIKGAGITLSEYVMPGLGGRRWSERHARDTAQALNQIDPDFIRLRSLIVRRNSRLGDLEAAGDFVALDDDGMVDEIGLLVEDLNCHAYLVSDQMSNLLWEVEGQLPEARPAILEAIRRYRNMPRRERLRLQLQRRAQSYLAIYGGMAIDLAETLAVARKALDDYEGDSHSVVQAAIARLKQGFM